MLVDRKSLRNLVNGKKFELFILGVILVNALILGMLTSSNIAYEVKLGLVRLDYLCLGIFVVEMLLKIIANGKNFFKEGWNVFDLAIILISVVPAGEAFIILRTFRVLRLLRLVSILPKLKNVSAALLAAIPSVISTTFLFMVFFYVFAVMAVYLFGGDFVEFASLGSSLFALFQTFTLDGWSNDIARPIMAFYPDAWIFFVSFIAISIFIVLSMVVSIITDVIEKSVLNETADENHDLNTEINERLKKLEKQLTKLAKK